MNISIIVAVDEDAGFGKDGKLPWNKPEDLKYFQKITKGSVCIMGRRTYEDIREMRGDAKELLPGRDCYVMSRTLESLDDASVVTSLSEVQEVCDPKKDIFFIGGDKIFTYGLTFATRVYMTIVAGRYDCDRFFPIAVLDKWFDIESGEAKDDLQFMVYKRNRS